MWLPRERGEREELKWNFGIVRCKLVCIGWINNKVLLYSTGNYIQYPVINHNEKKDNLFHEDEKKYVLILYILCVYVYCSKPKI